MSFTTETTPQSPSKVEAIEKTTTVSKGTINGGSMRLEGLAKFEKDTVLTDTSHTRCKRRNHRGESPERERNARKGARGVFDPDELLEKLEQHQFDPQCPQCQ